MATRGYLSRRSKKPSSSSQKGHKKKKLPPWDVSSFYLENGGIHKTMHGEYIKQTHASNQIM